MEKLGQVVYTNDWDYKVRIVHLREIGTKKMSFQLYVEAPNGTMSDITTIKLSDFNSKPKVLDFLYDMEGGFTFNDIASIKGNIHINDYKVIDIEEKLPVERIHSEVSKYIRKNGEELIDNIESEVFIRDGYGYIQVNRFEADLKTDETLKAIGYKKLEILKRLKILGALEPGKNRPYDYSIRINGELKRYYKILLTSEKEIEEKEDEEFYNEYREVFSVVRGKDEAGNENQLPYSGTQGIL
ncbi:hypothetical protein BLA28_20170 [Eisenbergiella tayi]|uniref:hypothetical protein n=1 Tax=Eisenbergiella tayi TaxID=1432052 RepID=UPI0008FD0BB2|nr:hypothetical protein [Eisenbergiella tayi]OIZ62713.1 hypothetical protein BLA28_20170 [Eisenbergiella tayi]